MIVNKAKVILWGSVPTELLLMSCFGEVERFQESGRISQIDDVVDLAGWSGVGGEFWKGKCALSKPSQSGDNRDPIKGG